MGRKKLYEGVMCVYCHNEPAAFKGMCKKCYSRSLYRKKMGIDVDPSVYYRRNVGNRNEKTKEIISRLKSGETESKVAKLMNVSRQWVNYIKIREGI